MKNYPGDFILDLDIVPQAVIDIKDWGYVISFGMASVEGLRYVDLPFLVSGRAGIIGEERGACQCWPHRNEEQERKCN